MSIDQSVAALHAQFEALPGINRLRELIPGSEFDPDTVREILQAAAKFSSEVLQPFDRQADATGCRMEHGRVLTADGHKAAWQAFSELGWNGIESPEEFGGMGLPLVVHSGCEELFNRGGLAFGMLATLIRCGMKLLERQAGDEIQREWLPQLNSGAWGATICISEPDAGSDIGRIRTSARPQEDGTWRIDGEKCWISFGDHDLTDRIGHMLLARTPDAPSGTAGLSLFIVPSTVGGADNGVVVRRIEEKLGLHASPTCVLGFEDATGYLIGEINRGLAQLFTMIVRMRLSVGCQGAAIAATSTDLAFSYAAERRQGGSPNRPPVHINEHGDVQRVLLGMAARAEVARGLVLTTSLYADLAEAETDPARKATWSALLGWMLPITKTFCAETAFAVSSSAIQVLGGAGYTREWPAEQYLRDSRILSIYEGTSGIQALDLVERRLIKDQQRGLKAFLASTESDLQASSNDQAATSLKYILELLVEASDQLQESDRDGVHAVAYHYLQLAALAATGWIALRLTRLAGDPASDRLAACGNHWLKLAPGLARKEASMIESRQTLLADWQAVSPG